MASGKGMRSDKGPSETSQVPPHLLAEAARLLAVSPSVEEVWGKLLVAGFTPGAVKTALALLPVQHARDERAHFNETALGHQAILLGQLSAQEGYVKETDHPDMVGKRTQQELAEEGVHVYGAEPLIANALTTVLVEAGLRGSVGQPLERAGNPHLSGMSDPVQRPALIVCGTRGNDRTLSEAINNLSVRYGIPALYYHAYGACLQLGPLVIPGQTACYACYRVRRDAALTPWERRLSNWADDRGQLACLPGTDWVVVDVIKFLAGLGEPVSRGRVLFVDYYAGLPEVHTVLRLPRCDVCGAQERPPIRLWNEVGA